MQSKQISPFTMTQIPRWRITRLLEMIQRDYSVEEVTAKLTGWLATGIERAHHSFNLKAATARAAQAISADDESLVRVPRVLGRFEHVTAFRGQAAVLVGRRRRTRAK